jgi:hypothetical protein
MPVAHKSVERTIGSGNGSPGGSRPSMSRCCISSASRPGRTRHSSPRSAIMCSRERSNAVVRSARGSSTTRVAEEGEALGWGGANIAGSWASRTTARRRSAIRSPASLRVAQRLYLPERWAQDPMFRQNTKIPDDVVFQTKPQIALDQISAAVAAGTPTGMILADGATAPTAPSRAACPSSAPIKSSTGNRP